MTKVTHTTSELFQFVSNFYDLIVDAASIAGIHEFLGKNWFTSTASKLFCGSVPAFCDIIAQLFITSDPNLDDLDRFAVYMSHEPNGTSVQSMLLYAQNMREDRF